MSVYELELNGYSGESDETDHLIVWVISESVEQVIKHMGEAITHVQNICHTDLQPDDGGVDFALPEDAKGMVATVSQLVTVDFDEGMEMLDRAREASCVLQKFLT